MRGVAAAGRGQLGGVPGELAGLGVGARPGRPASAARGPAAPGPRSPPGGAGTASLSPASPPSSEGASAASRASWAAQKARASASSRSRSSASASATAARISSASAAARGPAARGRARRRRGSAASSARRAATCSTQPVSGVQGGDAHGRGGGRGRAAGQATWRSLTYSRFKVDPPTSYISLNGRTAQLSVHNVTNWTGLWARGLVRATAADLRKCASPEEIGHILGEIGSQIGPDLGGSAVLGRSVTRPSGSGTDGHASAEALDDHRHALAAADAHGLQAELLVVELEAS